MYYRNTVSFFAQAAGCRKAKSRSAALRGSARLRAAGTKQLTFGSLSAHWQPLLLRGVELHSRATSWPRLTFGSLFKLVFSTNQHRTLPDSASAAAAAAAAARLRCRRRLRLAQQTASDSIIDQS